MISKTAVLVVGYPKNRRLTESSPKSRKRIPFALINLALVKSFMTCRSAFVFLFAKANKFPVGTSGVNSGFELSYPHWTQWLVSALTVHVKSPRTS
jgi:hypothetical protein